ncbi:hypothetical protein D3C85_995530 [compost metagenome]
MALGEPAQAVGSQEDAGRQKAQHGTDLEAVEQGDDDPRSGQEDHQIPILAAVRLAHPSSVTLHCDAGDHVLAIALASFMNFF